MSLEHVPDTVSPLTVQPESLQYCPAGHTRSFSVVVDDNTHELPFQYSPLEQFSELRPRTHSEPLKYSEEEHAAALRHFSGSGMPKSSLEEVPDPGSHTFAPDGTLAHPAFSSTMRLLKNCLEYSILSPVAPPGVVKKVRGRPSFRATERMVPLGGHVAYRRSERARRAGAAPQS